MDNLQLHATFYHSMGMNIAPIYNYDNHIPFKKPGIDITKWHSERQDITDVMNFDWSNATGIGLVTGFNGFRAIDVDSFLDTVLLEESNKDRVIGKILEQLDLPEDYQWIVKSGSGQGCHIIFQSDDLSDMRRMNYSFAAQSYQDDSDYLVRTYYPHAFKRMELSLLFSSSAIETQIQ